MLTQFFELRYLGVGLMNLAHIHIVLNHIPSLGSVAGLLMLVWAIYTKNDALKKSSFGVLVLIALATLPTYMSGNGARETPCQSQISRGDDANH
jgi:hypothetical protein